MLALLTDGFGSHGGIARYNQDLMTALAASPLIRDVIALPRYGSSACVMADKIVQETARAGRLSWSLEAAALALSRRPDVIFCGHINASPIAAMMARMLSRPLWVQAHGIDAWTDKGRAVRSALASAALVTAVSRYTRRKLLAWADIQPERVRVLPNTMEATYSPRQARPDLIRRYDIAGRKVILTVGRMSAGERYKGHDRILRCLVTVKERVPDVIYLVVGEGDDVSRLRSLAADLGVIGSVVFVGAVSGDELPDHYALADVFAMPSTGEGFGIVFLEAAASGLAVIGGNRDGSVDALADGAIGTPVDPDDLPALTTALTAALASTTTKPPEAIRRFAFDNFASHVSDLVQHFDC